MQRVQIISSCLLLYSFGVVVADQPGYSYGPPPKEETEVEVQKVEVYEVPWIGDQEPQISYGTPKQQYGPPSQEYGPPAQEYDPPNHVTTTDYPSIATTLSSANSTNVTVDSSNSTRNQTEKLEAFPEELSRGQYYIYHPTGLLQKVTYLTKDDSKNMAFSAQLRYENVDPVRGPIYTYDANTYVLSRISKR